MICGAIIRMVRDLSIKRILTVIIDFSKER